MSSFYDIIAGCAVWDGGFELQPKNGRCSIQTRDYIPKIMCIYIYICIIYIEIDYNVYIYYIIYNVYYIVIYII